MDSTSFDPANWSHWLLVGCFVGVSACGLMLSWRWGRTKRLRRKWDRRLRVERRRTELARRLSMNVDRVASPLPEVLKVPSDRDALRR